MSVAWPWARSYGRPRGTHGRGRRLCWTGVMNRVAVSIALSLALAGCSSFSSFSPGDWLPNLSLGGGGGGYPLRLESNPPGADARTSLGQGCRTPCTVSVPAREDFTVTFALPGYETQMVPVDLLRSGG